jgi:hypothetical protein
VSVHESHVPYPRHGRLWDETITGRQRGSRRDFLLRLGLDPARVPDGARIEHDDRTDEYRLEYINPGGHLVWVRRVLRPPASPRGGLIAQIQMEAGIDGGLAQLRDVYARRLDRIPYELPVSYTGRAG